MAVASDPPAAPRVARLISQRDGALGEDGETLLQCEPEGLALLEALGEEKVSVAAVAGQ